MTSTVYADPATGSAGPAVTVTVPASGRVLVTLTSRIAHNGSNTSGYMSFSATGSPPASAAGDATAVSTRVGNANSDTGEVQASASYVVTGLAPGSTTFKAYYRTTGVFVTFSNRNIIAIPLP